MSENKHIIYISCGEDSPALERLEEAFIAEGFVDEAGYSEAIAETGAVIFISDAAVAEQEWQTAVRSLPDTVRLIPVGRIYEAEINNPDVVPPRLASVNFIPLDDDYIENIRNSLTVDRDYYDTREKIMSNVGTWLMSDKSDAFVLSDAKELKRAKDLLSESAAEDLVRDYLTASGNAIRRSRRKKALNAARIAARLLMVALLICLFVFFYKQNERAKYYGILFSDDSSASLSAVTAVKMIEAVNSPYAQTETKKQAMQQLVDCLEECWPNTPIIADYDYAFNGAFLCGGERYLYTTDSGGFFARWDTWTGDRESGTKVSSQPLSVLASTDDGSILATSDQAGYLYISTDGGTKWTASADAFDLPFTSDLNLCCDPRSIAAITGDGFLLFTVDASGIRQTGSYSYDETYCLENADEGYRFVCRKDGTLYLVTAAGDDCFREEEISSDVEPSCNIALRDGKVLLTDADGQLLVWQSGRMSVQDFTLSTPTLLGWFSDSVIFYNDREHGNHLLDLEHGIDLGEMLDVVPAPTWVSSRNNTLMLYGNGMYYTIDLKQILPQMVDVDAAGPADAQTAAVNEVYYGVEASGTGMLRELKASDDGSVTVSLSLADGSSVQGDAAVHYSGRITAAGIRESGCQALIATSTGEFYEISFGDDGSFLVSDHSTTPAGCPVTRIIETGDGYLLEDELGVAWFVYPGLDVNSWDAVKATVRDRLHSAMGTDLEEMLSEKTIRELDLTFR